MIALKSSNKYNTKTAKTMKNNTKPVFLWNFIDVWLSDGEESTILYRLNRNFEDVFVFFCKYVHYTYILLAN